MTAARPTARAHLVVLSEDAGTLMGVKRAIEGALTADVALVRRADALLHRLDELATPATAVLMHWRLANHGALRCCWALRQRADGPPVIAFAQAWAGDALRRALQLGVAGIQRSPIGWDALQAELASLEGGEARSRRELLRRAPTLLDADPMLWRVGLTAAWRARMLALARHLREARRRADEPPDAVRWVIEALPPVLRDDRVDADRLRQLLCDAALPHHFTVDQDRLRALLHDPAAEAPIGPIDTSFLQQPVEQAIDHVRLLQLQEEFGPIVESIRGVDVDALRAALRPPPAWDCHLSPEALMRLRILAALLARARGVPDLETIVATYHEGRGLDAEEARVLDRLLADADLQDARDVLWRHLVGEGMTAEKVEKLLEHGRLEQASMGLGSLPDSLPRKPSLLNNLGLAFRAAHRYADAEIAYRHALMLRPDAPSLLFNLAVVVHDLGRDGEALTLVNQVLAARPDLEAAQRLKADVERRLGG